MSSSTPAAFQAPLPIETPLVRGPDPRLLRELLKNPNAPKDFQAYLITGPWADALSQFTTAFGAIPQRVSSAVRSAQSASVALTSLPTAGNSGVFRFNYHADITVPAGVSSSLIVTVTYTQNTVAKSRSCTAITGNTNNTVFSETWPIAVDANTPVQYSTTYASNPAGIMQYGLVVWLEQVNL